MIIPILSLLYITKEIATATEHRRKDVSDVAVALSQVKIHYLERAKVARLPSEYGALAN